MVVSDCPLPSRRKCLCNMPQDDSGHASSRCAMTCAHELVLDIFRRIINIVIIIIIIKHSQAGISRSVMLVVAYIMTVTGLGWKEALMAVRGARPMANIYIYMLMTC